MIALVYLESLAGESPLVGRYKEKLRAGCSDFELRYAKAKSDLYADLAAAAVTPEAKTRWARKRAAVARGQFIERDD